MVLDIGESFDRHWYSPSSNLYAEHMDEHALRVLEFDKVVGRVAAEAAFSVGRETVLAVRPETDFALVVERQSETAEMVLLDKMGIDVPFAAARDIRPTLRAAAVGQLLEPSALTEASETLRTAVRARRVIERVADRVPRLERIADRVGDFFVFTDAVERAISDRGEVLDSASDELATVRRELRLAQGRLEQRTQAALADAVRRGIVQEAFLTERNGRKVIPIKADYRGQMPGIVHDVSSSGATIFVEPLGVVDAGNDVRELQLAEDREVRRILQRLTDILGASSEEAEEALLALGKLDALRAFVRFGRKMRAQLPPPGDGASWLRPAGVTTIVRGRHPLLSGDVVPMDIDVGGEFPGLLITGPNTGGKTVAIKTLGLLTLMAQSGIPVPCDEGSRFTIYPRVFADIGDEQSIEQSLSTFSSHMRNIIEILGKAEPGTLVLLDELGAGTDPTEGSALARAVLETLLDRGCAFVATTHHGELKVFAHNDPRLRNASVEFDLESLSPTYKLTIGLPGQSNALAIAGRLGLGSDVIDRAQAQLAPGHFELEEMLDEIRREREAAAEARRREELARQETEEIRLSLAQRRDRIEQERTEILAAASREAEDTLSRLHREVERLRTRQLSSGFDAAAAAQTLKELDAEAGKLRQAARPRRAPADEALPSRSLAAGDRIHVRDIPQVGEALGDVGEDGRVDVQFGALRMKVSVDRIERVDPSSGTGKVVIPQPARPNVSSEIDLRGHRAEEALLQFETYVDEAFRAGLPFVRIIHGKGTGALRAAIREALTGHPLVRRFEAGAQNEGGDGVTVAVLAG